MLRGLHGHRHAICFSRVHGLASLLDLLEDGFVRDRVFRGDVGGLGVEGDIV